MSQMHKTRASPASVRIARMLRELAGPDPDWRYPGLTSEAVAKSFGGYQAEMAKILKKLGLSDA
jgi:hypothetical protein